tara:strand:- start:762 stop:1202 length:441 start_codon:yes stop_codon:yes gene_type:complete
MVNYQNGIIYTITTRGKVYVGSTCNFDSRKYNHKKDIERSNTLLYRTIIENDYEWEMKPYREFPCENRTQLIIEEERCRKELGAELNMKRCHTTPEQKVAREKDYYERNKERRAAREKEHYQRNKERIAARQKEYYQRKKAEKLVT